MFAEYSTIFLSKSKFNRLLLLLYKNKLKSCMKQEFMTNNHIHRNQTTIASTWKEEYITPFGRKE